MGVNRGRVGSICASIAVVCLIIGMVVDDISGVSPSIEGYSELKFSCGWKRGTTSSSFQGSSHTYTVHSNWNSCCGGANSSNKCCKTRDAGQTYIACGIITCIISFCAIVTSFLQRFSRVHVHIRWVFLLSMILLAVAWIVWMSVNSFKYGCYDTDQRGFYNGASLVLYIIADILYLFAFGLTFKLKDGIDGEGYQTF